MQGFCNARIRMPLQTNHLKSTVEKIWKINFEIILRQGLQHYLYEN